MLLKLYLATTIFSCSVFVTTWLACDKRLKREGYSFKNNHQNVSLPEKIISSIQTLLFLSIPMLIPVFNITMTFRLITKFDEEYEEFVTNRIKEGKLYKIDEKELNGASEDKNLTINKPNSIVDEESKNKKEKAYSEMTKEEKIAFLEREKRTLLGNSTQNNCGLEYDTATENIYQLKK